MVHAGVGPKKPEKPPSTFVEILRNRALQQPNDIAYTFLVDGETQEVTITYEALDQKARAIAAQLQQLNAVGERVLLLYPPGLEFIASLFGCFYAGAIAVPTYPPDPSRLNRTLPRLQGIALNSQAKFLLTTLKILSMTDFLFSIAPDLKKLKWLATDQLPEDLTEKLEMPRINEDTIAFLQFTSGSTATPRGVVLSHSNILHNERMIQECFQHSENSVAFGWLPQYHDMGLIGHILQPLYVGFPTILMSPLDFLKHPFFWLKAISKYKVTSSGGPNFSYELCVRKIKPDQVETLDLSSWELAYCGAEPIRSETLNQFSKTFEPCGFNRKAFYPCYGLAEATLLVTGIEKASSLPECHIKSSEIRQNKIVVTNPNDEEGKSLVGCGNTRLNQRVLIVDPQSRIPCPAGKNGEIWVSGPSVAKGYWNLPELTKETFQASLANSGEGPFLRTGDLGFTENGQLFVTGRLKDLIILRGQNHYPEDIERTVAMVHPSLRLGCGAAFSIEDRGEESLVVVQEVDSTPEIKYESLLAEIRRAIIENHMIQVYNLLLIKPKTIPKTSSGKIQRYKCREEFLKGALEVIVQYTRNPS